MPGSQEKIRRTETTRTMQETIDLLVTKNDELVRKITDQSKQIVSLSDIVTKQSIQIKEQTKRLTHKI